MPADNCPNAIEEAHLRERAARGPADPRSRFTIEELEARDRLANGLPPLSRAEFRERRRDCRRRQREQDLAILSRRLTLECRTAPLCSVCQRVLTAADYSSEETSVTDDSEDLPSLTYHSDSGPGLSNSEEDSDC